jgi:hypothetical protein
MYWGKARFVLIEFVVLHYSPLIIKEERMEWKEHIILVFFFKKSPFLYGKV